VSREPLSHLLHYLMQNQPSTRRPKILELLFFKLDHIVAGYERLLDASSVKWIRFHELLAGENESTVNEWVSLLVACALEGVSEIQRRIGGMVRTCPAKLGWLVFTEDHLQVCERRRQLADELLQGQFDDDHSFTKKFVDFFKSELKHCSKTGMLDHFVHQLLTDFFEMMVLDTQEIEGANSIVKKMVHLAPNIHLPLLSDRLLMKKVLTPQVTSGDTADERRQARLDAIQYSVEKHQEAIQELLVFASLG